jgi:hypothetical protein
MQVVIVFDASFVIFATFQRFRRFALLWEKKQESLAAVAK